MRQKLIFFFILLGQFSLSGQNLEGSWKGDLEFSGRKMDIIIFFEKNNDQWSGTLSSQTQQLKDLSINAIEFVNPDLKFQVPMAGGKWEGKLISSTELKGDWIQGPYKTTLNFEKLTARPKVEIKERIQTPIGPYPYSEEEITYENTRDGTRLAATLTIPAGEGPFPAAILLTVAGANDRDQSHGSPQHKPYKVLADHLSRNGFAVLRADDRSIGSSTGDLFSSTIEDFAYDALAGVAYLRNHSKIDPTKIGFIGNSEGTLVGPLAASIDQESAFIITLGGIGIPGDQVILDQIEGIGKLSGFDRETIQSLQKSTGLMLEMIKSGMDSTLFAQEVNRILSARKKLKADTRLFLLPQSIEEQVKIFSSPWYWYQVNYKPSEVLSKTTIPFLAIHGDVDPYVLPDKNLEAIGKHLRAANNKHFALIKLDGLNHLMQDVKTGSPADYTVNEISFSPRVLALITTWLNISLDQSTR